VVSRDLLGGKCAHQLRAGPRWQSIAGCIDLSMACADRCRSCAYSLQHSRLGGPYPSRLKRFAALIYDSANDLWFLGRFRSVERVGSSKNQPAMSESWADQCDDELPPETSHPTAAMLRPGGAEHCFAQVGDH
jgi:hypothetical protein